MDWRNQFFDSLSGETTESTKHDQRLEVLLTDYLVAVRAGKKLADTQHIGANLAMNSSADDADDIDWSVMTHPGSVIWSALLHQIFTYPQTATRFKGGAYAAYRTSASIAGFFGGSHRAKWHVTTTAGTFAAATASNVLHQATPEQSLSSLLHVAANMGGIAVADRRTGAAIFNRGAAVSLGILASEAALSGMPHATNVWDGDRGLFALFSLSNDSQLATIRDGISTAGLRLFPCNGFVQGAYMAITDCKDKLDGELLSMRVGLTQAMVPFLDGSVGGDYWSAHHSAAKAWSPCDINRNIPLIEIVGRDIPLGGAEVEVKTTTGKIKIVVERAPGMDFFAGNEKQWRVEKHQRLIGQAESLQAERFAQKLLAGDSDLAMLKSFIS